MTVWARRVAAPQFRGKFREKKGIACGVCCQFLIVPFLGYLACTAFELDAVYGALPPASLPSPDSELSFLCLLFLLPVLFVVWMMI